MAKFQKNCSVNELSGTWEFWGTYHGRKTNADTLKPNTWTTPIAPRKCIFKKTGEYINDYGDSTTNGKFMIEESLCELKKYDDNGAKGDTVRLEVTYLSYEFLLLVVYGTLHPSLTFINGNKFIR